MGVFLQREEYQCVNSDQKHSANGQSTKRCPLVSLMLDQNGQLGLEILFILYNKLFVHDTLWMTLYWKIASLISFVTQMAMSILSVLQLPNYQLKFQGF